MARAHPVMYAEALERRLLLAGVELVKDIVPGPGPSIALRFSIDEHAIARGKFFFEASDENGTQVWVSDGTADGTKPLIPPGVEGSALVGRMLAGDDGNVYFNGQSKFGNQIFRTNGTKAGTIGLVNATFGTGVEPIGFVNGQLVYYTDNTVSPHLWHVGASEPEILGLGISGASAITTIGTKLFLSTHTAASGFPKGIYVTDGKTLTLLHTGAANTTTVPLGVNLNGKAIFSANADSSNYEIWRSDGTPNGTKRVTNIFPDDGTPQTSLTVSGNKVYFLAAGQVYSTDGNTATRITNYSNVNTEDGTVRDLVDVNGTLFFTHGSTVRNLYKLVNDKPVLVGTESGGAQGGTKPAILNAVGTTLYFTALDKAGKARLFQSDGATISLVGGVAVTDPVPLGTVKGNLFLQADTDATGGELFVVKSAEPTPEPPTKFTVSLKVLTPTVAEGSQAIFKATISGGKLGAVYKYRWDFDGDGTLVPDQATARNFYRNNLPNDAPRTVRVKAIAPDGTFDNATAQITVTNAPPYFNYVAFRDQWVTSLPLQGSVEAIDPGKDDRVSVKIKWGDGTLQDEQNAVPIEADAPNRGIAYFKHGFQKPSTTEANVRIQLTDNEGAVAVRRITVKILPLARINADGAAITLLDGSGLNDTIQIMRSPKQPGTGKIRVNILRGDPPVLDQTILVDPEELLLFSLGKGTDKVKVDESILNPLLLLSDGTDELSGNFGKVVAPKGAVMTGTPSSDDIDINRVESFSNKSQENILVNINGIGFVPITLPKTDIFSLYGGGGADSLGSTQATTQFNAYGGNGKDTLTAGSGPSDLFGGRDKDKFRNIGANDEIKQ